MSPVHWATSFVFYSDHPRSKGFGLQLVLPNTPFVSKYHHVQEVQHVQVSIDQAFFVLDEHTHFPTPRCSGIRLTAFQYCSELTLGDFPPIWSQTRPWRFPCSWWPFTSCIHSRSRHGYKGYTLGNCQGGAALQRVVVASSISTVCFMVPTEHWIKKEFGETASEWKRLKRQAKQDQGTLL